MRRCLAVAVLGLVVPALIECGSKHMESAGSVSSRGQPAAVSVPGNNRQRAVLTGRVLTIENMPIRGARVSVSSTSAFTYTDSTGAYRLDVPKGKFGVIVEAYGVVPAEQTFDSLSGSTITCDLRVITYVWRRPGSPCFATYVTRLPQSSVIRARLDEAVERSRFANGLRDGSAAMLDKITARDFLDGTRIWALLPIPPAVAEPLQGAALYAVTDSGRYVRKLFAMWGDTLYDLPRELNQLLCDRGTRFGNSDAPKWAWLIAYIDHASERFGAGLLPERHGDHREQPWRSWDSIACGRKPIVPAFTIDSLLVDYVEQAEDNDPAHPDSGLVNVRKELVRRVRAVLRTATAADTTLIYAQSGPFPEPRMHDHLNGMVFPVRFRRAGCDSRSYDVLLPWRGAAIESASDLPQTE